MKQVKTKQQRDVEAQTKVNMRANRPVFTTYSLCIILEGYSLDIGMTECYDLAVSLREFLNTSDLAEDIGNSSDALGNILIRLAPKAVLVPIICDAIWRESRKFTQIYRQYDPYFTFGQEKVVRGLLDCAEKSHIDSHVYGEFSKVINALKKV